ncbi:MAG TPA: AMP-binding protein, partial [Mycobacterium sp.]|nr:AMP-binding protein [Mycobacterium sp.]
ARSGREVAGEAARTLPRLARLGRLQPHTRVSLGALMAEQANRAPEEECFLFEDRVHTNAAVDHRIDDAVRGLIAVGVRQGAHIGVLMDTSPAAVTAIAALSRLGAVAVLLPPDDDLASAVQLCEVADIVTDPHHLAAATATGARVLVLGHVRTAHLGRRESDRVVELDRLDLSGAQLPQWYRPNPGRARDLAFVFFSTTGGRRVVKEVTNHRWALSAYGTATAAALGRGDTIYCLTPLHHPSGLMVSLGGAVAGGSRIALTRGVDPTRFADEVHRYGVTVVSYTWAMLRELVEATSPELAEHHPIRMFIGAGCRPGYGRRSPTDSPRPECWSSTPPPRATRCWPMSPARRPGPRVDRCRAAPRFGSPATTRRRAGLSRMATVSCAPARTTRWACC